MSGIALLLIVQMRRRDNNEYIKRKLAQRAQQTWSTTNVDATPRRQKGSPTKTQTFVERPKSPPRNVSFEEDDEDDYELPPIRGKLLFPNVPRARQPNMEHVVPGTTTRTASVNQHGKQTVKEEVRQGTEFV